MFFFAPFVWILAVPAVLLGILVIRSLLWLRSLTKPNHQEPPAENVIEGQFIDDENEQHTPEN